MEQIEYIGPQIVEGNLKKLKNQKATLRFLSKFVMRWFVLDIRTRTFGYFKNSGKKKLLKSHPTQVIHK